MPSDLRLDDYLKRIGYNGPLRPDLATLSRLHAAHVDAIPFEGLDPLLGRPVKLDLESLQTKFFTQRRGGYCFEQNALFKAALETIGFDVTGLTGRVRWMAPPESPLGPRVHMLLKVDLPEGPYLADVGFGAHLLDTPFPLVTDMDHRTAMGTFRLTEKDGHHWLSAKQPAGPRVMYVFDLVPQMPSDYELGNWFTATNSYAPFTTTLIMERLAADRRYKLINRRFITEARDGEVIAEQPVESAKMLGDILDTTFGVTPPAPAEILFAKVSQT